MRVIAGSAKGTRLGPVPPGVRPVSDRAREGLFSSLAPEVPGARVLDLYAGSGALGIEALSRGAERAVFVERARAAVAAIRTNLGRARLGERATVVQADVSAYLAGPPPERPFELAFADPPYDLGAPALEGVLRDLASRWLAGDRWSMALTRGPKSSTPVVPVHWAVARRLRYGDGLVIVYREVRWA